MNADHLVFLERKPLENAGSPAPLLIMLHGYGSNEADLFSFADELPASLHIVSLRAPHALGSDSHAWYSIDFDADQNKFSNLEEANASLKKITAFVEEFTAQETIDASRVFVLGFSQGAILSYALALNTNRIGHVMALSGYLNEDLVSENPPAHCVDFFVSHGTLDQVIPVDWARKAPAFLSSKKHACQYKEYPAGHGVHPQNFYDLKNWLQERL